MPVKKAIELLCLEVALVLVARYGLQPVNLYITLYSHVTASDFWSFHAKGAPVGVLDADPLQHLGLNEADLRETSGEPSVRFIAKTRYLNNARAVVTHTIDDSTPYIAKCLDILDKYDIKATIFVSTQHGAISQLWPRLRQAIKDGHEVGAHSRNHLCHPFARPDTWSFCFGAYSYYEVAGSRDDILAHLSQSHVWSWAYPCGNCAGYESVHRKLAQTGYLVARDYPGESKLQNLVPDLQAYADDPYDASYTQIVQNAGPTPAGRTDVCEIDAKFDEVYRGGGIYSFVSHPQWIDYGPDMFYERHLAHISRRADLWYVPIGPLYAYETVRETTKVDSIDAGRALARFVIHNNLDPEIYRNSLTLRFAVPPATRLRITSSGRELPPWSGGLTDRWDAEYYRRQAQELFVTIRPNTILEIDQAAEPGGELQLIGGETDPWKHAGPGRDHQRVSGDPHERQIQAELYSTELTH